MRLLHLHRSFHLGQPLVRGGLAVVRVDALVRRRRAVQAVAVNPRHALVAA